MIGIITDRTDRFTGITKYSLNLYRELSKHINVELHQSPKIEFKIKNKAIGGDLSFKVLATLRNYKADLTHAVAPRVANSNTDIVTVHDVFHLTMPQVSKRGKSTPKMVRDYTKKLSEMKAIIVQSNAVKNDLENYSGSTPIYVIPTAVPKYMGELKNPFPDDGKIHLVTLGDILPHRYRKRIEELYDFVKNNTEVDLYHIGKLSNPKYVNFAPNIHYVGAQISEQLKYSYFKYADKFVFYSLGEGQGYPVMEATRMGAQPVVNEIPVHKEFLGDSAHYFSDKDTFLEAVLKPNKHGLEEKISKYDNWIEKYIEVYREIKPEALEYKQ